MKRVSMPWSGLDPGDDALDAVPACGAVLVSTGEAELSVDHVRSHVYANHMQKDHYHNLDFLRGLAALCVVLIHISVRLDLPHVATHAYIGVDFFFALSGFVMCSAYKNDLER